MNLSPPSPLELRGVSGTCSDGAGVSGISAAFSAGRLHLVRGAQGSGKSALFRFAGLLAQPAEGEVLMDGSATCGLDEAARTEQRRHVADTAVQKAAPSRETLAEATKLTVAAAPSGQPATAAPTIQRAHKLEQEEAESDAHEEAELDRVDQAKTSAASKHKGWA